MLYFFSDIFIVTGYSRVPIYNGDINNIRNVLMTKDLALIDPDDKIPVSVLCQNLEYKCIYMSGDTKLDTAFRKIKEGICSVLSLIKSTIVPSFTL